MTTGLPDDHSRTVGENIAEAIQPHQVYCPECHAKQNGPEEFTCYSVKRSMFYCSFEELTVLVKRYRAAVVGLQETLLSGSKLPSD